MSSVSASRDIAPKKYSVDLLLFENPAVTKLNWQYGNLVHLKNMGEHAQIQEINTWAENSQADYLLLWNESQNLPKPEVLFSIIASGVDLAHCGLKQGLGAPLQDLYMLGFSWDKLNAPPEIINTSWRLGLETCLIRRKLFLSIGGLDPVFHSQSGAGLEFGYRSLKLGAIIEHRPEMCKGEMIINAPEPPVHDFYCFVLRHFGVRWGWYTFFRRLGRTINWGKEIRSWQSARHICKTKPADWSLEKKSIPASFESTSINHFHHISVIIPTLGRYEYIPGALKSLLEQTIPADEVIVVDQNPLDVRQPEIYNGYEKLNLRVIWQDERGQSLARNTGLAAAKGEFVFLFDDDSIAYPDLIERHLAPLLSGQYDVSTGVAVPPLSTSYVLPPNYQFPRLSQTFDTGNSLMRMDLIRRMGGLDRNFDFGPGTDADLGTRLYLAGCRILHNPEAVRVHYKAPIGGLRVHGAHKYNTDAGLFQPFPPITQSYYALRYLNAFQHRETAWLSFLTSKFPANIRSRGTTLQKIKASFIFLLSLFLYPVKHYRSTLRAKQLLAKGPQLFNFESES